MLIRTRIHLNALVSLTCTFSMHLHQIILLVNSCTCVFGAINQSKGSVGKECSPESRYRTFDGSCNNLDHPTWGQAGTAQRRFTHPDGSPMVEYADGVDEPRCGLSYQNNRLPSPRVLSNTFGRSDDVGDQSDHTRSGVSMSFGQLLAHDFLHTEIHTGTQYDCCNSSSSHYNDSNVCFNFKVPEGDETFTPGCKSFLRAKKATMDNDLPAYRENINQLSSYIDAGFLYGNSDDDITLLRDDDTYLMKVDGNGLMPTNQGGDCVPYHGRCPLAGDARVHIAPSLGVTLTLWLHEHNRIAKILDQMNPNIPLQCLKKGSFYQETREDIIFQETRRIIIAMVQHITYNHYLPSILDDVIMQKYDLYSSASGFDETYNSSVDASLRNGFGTAPFRFGHTQIMPTQCMLYENLTLDELPIENTIKDPELYYINNGSNVQSIARWLALKPANTINNFMIDGVRNKLFANTESTAQDLFSLNIQRGRDQGTPGYNKWRQLCGLSNKTFEDFGNYSERLAALYRSPDDIDFFLGGILEKGVNGTVGETFACIIAKQFQLIKTGDRFWYERPDNPFSFTKEQLRSIKEGANLAKIYCRAYNLTRIHKDLFLSSLDKSLLVDCNDLPEVDLSVFKIKLNFEDIQNEISGAECLRWGWAVLAIHILIYFVIKQ